MPGPACSTSAEKGSGVTAEMLGAAAAILFLSSILQSIIGFAFNLLAIPLLLWSGFTLAQAVAVTSVPILIQVSVATWKLRIHVPWREVLPAAGIRYLFLPVGISPLSTGSIPFTFLTALLSLGSPWLSSDN